MKLVIIPIILFLLPSCSTNNNFPEKQLVNKILRVRLAYIGKLTNSFIEEDQYKIKEYDMQDKSFREAALSMSFICDIGTHRWKICREKAGYCRKEEQEKKVCTKIIFWNYCRNKKVVIDLYKDAIKDHVYLHEAGTSCFNENVY